MSFEEKRWIFHQIHKHCSDTFYYKHSEQIYRVIQEDYLWLDLRVDEETIAKVVQDFKDFWERNDRYER